MERQLDNLFVTEEISNQLKKLGYDAHYISGTYQNPDGQSYSFLGNEYKNLPLWQQAHMWLMEQGITIDISSYSVDEDIEQVNDEYWHYQVAVTCIQSARTHNDFVKSGYLTYLDALEDAIKKALILIESNFTCCIITK